MKILQSFIRNNNLNLKFYSSFLLGISFIMSSAKSFGTSCDTSSSYQKNKLIYPAASRNKEPILEVLKKQLPVYFSLQQDLNFVEISSGSGQHIAHFAPNFPKITFQPTEYEEDLLGSIGIYADECVTKNVKQPILVDICEDMGTKGFKPDSIDIIYNANMMHISPFACSEGLFTNAGRYLKPNGVMITYGPFSEGGVITPQSNVDFDFSLKSRDSRWGIRDLGVLQQLAQNNNLTLREIVPMPANNKCVIWTKNNNVNN